MKKIVTLSLVVLSLTLNLFGSEGSWYSLPSKMRSLVRPVARQLAHQQRYNSHQTPVNTEATALVKYNPLSETSPTPNKTIATFKEKIATSNAKAIAWGQRMFARGKNLFAVIGLTGTVVAIAAHEHIQEHIITSKQKAKIDQLENALEKQAYCIELSVMEIEKLDQEILELQQLQLQQSQQEKLQSESLPLEQLQLDQPQVEQPQLDQPQVEPETQEKTPKKTWSESINSFWFDHY